jgi:Nif-specific regulatory protein
MQENADNAYLIVQQNRRWSDVFRLLKGQPTVIGRSSSCQIVIPDDRSSRHHAQIDWKDGTWVLRDLGSRNGTQVDGEDVQSEYVLSDGDRIQIAGSTFSFTYDLKSVSNSSGPTDSGAPLEPQATADLTDAATQEPLILHSHKPRRWVAELAVEMMECANISEAAEVALDALLKRCGIQAGAVLLTQQMSVSRILATRERGGKAYHRVSDFLVKKCLTDKRAILARNIQDDQQFVDLDSSLSSDSSSVICVPIFDSDQVYGLIHIYTRSDERELTTNDLDWASAAAEPFGVTFSHQRQKNKLGKKLQQSRRRAQSLQMQLNEVVGSDSMLGQSPALQQLRKQIARVARTDATVLLRGESGVGKELAARQIHLQSSRAQQPFVAVNCAALTSSILESELFGHEKGSFTGATEQKIGKFEMANGGTLMLDEVGEMSPEIQAKFLRVLEGQPFERVGGSKPIAVDVRIVAATNRDLEQAVKQGLFRSDLYFRLRVVELVLPSLRERREDIVPLAESFLANFRAKSGHGPSGFSAKAIDAMNKYHWPGNIRELKNCVERAYVLSNHELAEPEDLALSYLTDSPPQDHNPCRIADTYREVSLADLEKEHILATLQYTQGQKSRAATILGIERSTLDRKLKRFDGTDDSPLDN